MPTRVVLHQLLAPGERDLESILETADADAVLTPVPPAYGSGQVVLVRRAEENGAGLHWPDPPPAWDAYRGEAVRQRLSEVCCGPAERTFRGSGYMVELSGLSGWPIASLFGACQEAVEG